MLGVMDVWGLARAGDASAIDGLAKTAIKDLEDVGHKVLLTEYRVMSFVFDCAGCFGACAGRLLYSSTMLQSDGAVNLQHR